MREKATTDRRPGLVDLQVNGHKGVDFNRSSLCKEEVEQVCSELYTEGVVGFLPTLITNEFSEIEKLARIILSADGSPGAKILGLHLEGPFISPQPGARGAHPVQWVQAPDFDWVRKMHDLSGGRIRILTFSPEWEDSAEFVENVCNLGIRVAIGHTLADSQQISDAVAAGASLATHLGNGIPPNLPRHPNPIWSQLAEDRLWISLIGDGFHLPEEVFRVFLKVKGKKTLLVSDSTEFAGRPPGRYQSLIGGDVVLSERGKLHLAEDENLMAGSAMSLRRIIDSIVQRGWLDFESAWELGSVRPWEYLGETEPLTSVRCEDIEA